jgi:alkanesulfonate monooxygenase SsuD/methylene tetrahydromethanopterin reductase-like flavin-dependent oxidoreductase (luciferase family)
VVSSRLPGKNGLHWGLSLPNRGILFGAISVEELLDLAKAGEDSAFFGSVWIGDSLLDRPRVDSIPLLGALSTVTKHVWLGVSCFASFIVRHPIEVAIQWASVDILTGGRTVWTACVGGGVAREIEPFGIRRSERVPRLVEGLELVKRFWTEDRVDHEGRFWQFHGVSVEPKPTQKPRPPIWLAVTPDDEKLSPEMVDRALIRALEHTDGWQGGDTDAEHIGRLCRRIAALREEGRGRAEFFPCSAHVHITIDDDRSRAWQMSTSYFRRYYPEDFISGGGELPDELIQRFHTWGTPEDCANGLLRFVSAGCSIVIVRFAADNQTHQLKRFLAEVAPILRAKGPTSLSAWNGT